MTGEEYQLMQRLIVDARCDGMCEGVELYAHWKDGVQYVGTCGRTLKEALADIEEERLNMYIGIGTENNDS